MAKSSDTTMQETAARDVHKRMLSGVVVSDKMDKTVTVSVERTYRHPKLGKTVRTKKKYKVHDEQNSAHIGDVIEMSECRPLSKTKHMVLERIITTAEKEV